MTRVVHILSDSNFGGAGRYLLNYLQYRDRDAFDVTVVLPKNAELIPMVEELGVPVVTAERISDQSLSLGGVLSLCRVLRRLSPEIVHTHGSFSGRVAGKLCGARVVFTRHSAFPVAERLKKGPMHTVSGTMNRLFADRIIAVSPAAAENLTDMGVDERRITVMMNGSPPLHRSSEEERRKVRRSLNLPEGVFTTGIFARLEPYKGQMLLLDAVKTLTMEGRVLRVLIAGNGSQKEALRQRILELGLMEQVRLLGFVKDVEPLMNVLDLQLNCSSGTETSSLSLIEGMSIGVPVLASDYGGNPALIDDGVTGVLFKTGDCLDLTRKLRDMMDRPDWLARLGENAKTAYETHYTGSGFARGIEAVYRLAREGK